jgi:hypothetical protein
MDKFFPGTDIQTIKENRPRRPFHFGYEPTVTSVHSSFLTDDDDIPRVTPDASTRAPIGSPILENYLTRLRQYRSEGFGTHPGDPGPFLVGSPDNPRSGWAVYLCRHQKAPGRSCIRHGKTQESSLSEDIRNECSWFALAMFVSVHVSQTNHVLDWNSARILHQLLHKYRRTVGAIEAALYNKETVTMWWTQA